MRRLVAFRQLSKQALLSITLVSVLALLVIYGAYRSFVISGHRAEAHLMTSYLQSLENAYHLENKSSLGFPDYGAAQRGVSKCSQPSGAKLLGFSIRWCQGVPGAKPARYTYRVEVGSASERDYTIYATSGSDSRGGSFVCFGMDETDAWAVYTNGKRSQISHCW